METFGTLIWTLNFDSYSIQILICKHPLDSCYSCHLRIIVKLFLLPLFFSIKGIRLKSYVSLFSMLCFIYVDYSTSFLACVEDRSFNHLWQKITTRHDLVLLRFVQTNSPTLARQGDDLGYITIWATLPRRLVFWDGGPSPYKWYQRHSPNLVICVGDVRSQRAQRRGH